MITWPPVIRGDQVTKPGECAKRENFRGLRKLPQAHGKFPQAHKKCVMKMKETRIRKRRARKNIEGSPL